MSSSTPGPLATSSVLYAAAKFIGEECREKNVAFIECKARDDDPRVCLEKVRRRRDGQ